MLLLLGMDERLAEIAIVQSQSCKCLSLCEAVGWEARVRDKYQSKLLIPTYLKNLAKSHTFLSHVGKQSTYPISSFPAAGS